MVEVGCSAVELCCVVFRWFGCSADPGNWLFLFLLASLLQPVPPLHLSYTPRYLRWGGHIFFVFFVFRVEHGSFRLMTSSEKVPYEEGNATINSRGCWFVVAGTLFGGNPLFSRSPKETLP